jgi:transposase
MRHALHTLAVVAPAWLRARTPPAWVDRYAARMENYRLPSDEAARYALVLRIGADGAALLAALWDPPTAAGLRTLEAVEVLQRIWVQQFYQEEGNIHWREQGSLPPASNWINSPYDPEVRYGNKRTATRGVPASKGRSPKQCGPSTSAGPGISGTPRPICSMS